MSAPVGTRMRRATEVASGAYRSISAQRDALSPCRQLAQSWPVSTQFPPWRPIGQLGRAAQGQLSSPEAPR